MRSLGKGAQGPVKTMRGGPLPVGLAGVEDLQGGPPSELGTGPWLRGLVSLLQPEKELDTAAKMPYPVVRARLATPEAPGGAPIPVVRTGI